MIEFVYSLESDPKRAFEEIKAKAREIGFEPNLAIFFLTEKLQKNPELFKFDFTTLSIPVEGIITPGRIWMRGCLCMLADVKYNLNVLRGKASEVVERLRDVEKGRFNLLVYPLFYIENWRSFIGNYLRLKLTSDATKASRIYENGIYPMNSLLRSFRDEGKTAASFNLFPLKFGVGRPQIYLNGGKVGRGVIHLAIDRKFDVEYTDFLPERGKSVEETKEILKQEFQFIKEVEVNKSGIVISEVDGRSVKDFLREYRIRMRGELEKDVEEERFFGASPYIISLISKETFGSACLGLFDYDLKMYPSLFDLDVFMDTGIFFGEKISGGVERVKKELNAEADFIALDQNLALMFEKRLVEVFKDFSGFGAVTSYPSKCGPNSVRRMSEIEKDIFVNATLSTIMIKF